MTNNFTYTYCIGDVCLDVKASYWTSSRRARTMEDVELIDVLHRGESIIEFMSPTFIEKIEESLAENAAEDWMDRSMAWAA